MDPELLRGLRAIVDPTRLRILGRLATRPADAETLAGELGLALPAVRKQLEPLVHAGLVEDRGAPGGSYGARLDRVGGLARDLAGLEASMHGRDAGPDGAWPHDGESLAETLARMGATPEDARTLRAYLVDGRVQTIPAQPGKRQVLLRFLLERVFTEDRDYPEKEVNQRLALFHPDVAALRRYLVDDGHVQRGGGLYRRRGERPELSPPSEPAREPAGPEPAGREPAAGEPAAGEPAAREPGPGPLDPGPPDAR